MEIIHYFEQKQQQKAEEFEGWVQGILEADPNDSDYFYNRLYTNIGAESLLIAGGVG